MLTPSGAAADGAAVRAARWLERGAIVVLLRPLPQAELEAARAAARALGAWAAERFDPTGLRLARSATAGLAAVALRRGGAVAVDVERLPPLPIDPALWDAALHPDERCALAGAGGAGDVAAAWAGARPPERDVPGGAAAPAAGHARAPGTVGAPGTVDAAGGFAAAWARKEALLKLLGVGLAVSPGGIALPLPAPRGWHRAAAGVAGAGWVRLLRGAGAGWRCAVASDRPVAVQLVAAALPPAIAPGGRAPPLNRGLPCSPVRRELRHQLVT